MASTPKPRPPSIEDVLRIAEVAAILGVHARTLARRRAAGGPVRALEAQREEKLRRIWRDLLELFEPETAARWLRCPSPVLQNRPPLAVMAEDGGLDRVLDVIGRMSWGIPA
jgi:putative toxin-antitoxin system antitoxin component (TIGR02293 family)